MKRCAIYARVSTADQAQVKDGSLDTQLDLLQDAVKLRSRSGDEEWRVVARYREEGQSGKNTDRPQYQKLLADVDTGKVDTVVCTKIDRITRSLPDFYHLLETLEQRGASFISLAESLDTSTATGRAVMKILLVIAELEREQTSERTTQKLAWRARKGLANGGQILGYDVDPNNPGIPTVNPQERQLVSLIYETYLQEKSYRRTAEIINRKGYRSKSYVSRRGKIQPGKAFATMSIKRILLNPFYKGQITHKGAVYDGQHEPIIAADSWERVQCIAASNKGAKARAENLHVYQLKGLVRCGECGAAMTPYYGAGRHGKVYHYYTCSNRNRRGPDACSMANVPAGPLEQVVAARLIELSQQDHSVERLVQEAMIDIDEVLGNYTQRRSALSAHQRRVQRQIEHLIEALKQGRTKSVAKEIVELEAQEEQLDDEILVLDNEIDTAKKKVVSAQALTTSLTTFGDLYQQATDEERRHLIQLRLNRLIWTPQKIRLAFFPGEGENLVAGVQRDVTVGSPYGIRTRATGVRGRRPRPLDERANSRHRNPQKR